MEEEKKSNIIRVGVEDEIMEIIDRIKSVPDRTVTLVIPQEAALFQDITNLKILQKRSQELGKEISVSRTGGEGEVASAGNQAAVSTHKVANRPASEPKRVSDMVRKSDTVDLRSPQPKPEPEPAAEAEEVQAAPLAPSQPAASAQAADDAFWNGLAEEKDEAEDRPEANAEPKAERIRINPEQGYAKNFDFSYPMEKKKKKFSLLPTLSGRFFAFFILACLVTAGISLYFILPKADIRISLKQEEVKGSFNLIADQKLQDIDAKAGELPAAKTVVSSTKTQTFTTTSKKHVSTSASGEITIYNECSTGAQILVAGTRFLSKEGKVFKIESAASVPGFTKPEADTVPGAVTVKVTAADAGEAYNIAATNFTIPAYQDKDDWRASCLYARSSQAMTGGSDKDVNYVSQDDYDKAKAQLTQAVEQDNQTKSEGQKSDDKVLLNDAQDQGTVDIKSSVEVNAVAESFDMTATVNKSVLSVTKADLEKLLQAKIAELNTHTNAQAVAGSLTYQIGDITNKDQQITISTNASEKFAFTLDQDQIKKDVVGKNKVELNQYFAQMDGVQSVSVNLWPFWVSKVPDSTDKVNLTLDSGAGV